MRGKKKELNEGNGVHYQAQSGSNEKRAGLKWNPKRSKEKKPNRIKPKTMEPKERKTRRIKGKKEKKPYEP